MYASPQVDMGYDISDHEAVYAPFGSMEDMEALIAGAHKRGLKVLLDLVMNHTSDQHAWFKESKISRDNEKSEWYIWRDGRVVDGELRPPNNWRSFFGERPWEYVEERGQWYFQ